MNRRRLEELAERMAALEGLAGGTIDATSLDARLSAIEDAIRRLRYDDEDLGEIDDTVRRCRELVGEHVPVGERVAVVSEGDPALLARYDRPIAAFPQGALAGSPDREFGHGAAAIAQLEALRAQDAHFLLVPEPKRSLIERFPELVEHLLIRYQVVADEPGAGLLVDIGTPRASGQAEGPLTEVLDRLVEGDRYAPVLDWTGLELGSVTGGRNVFAAPSEIDGELPYLDRTIEVVVIDDAARREEARRVASGAVLMVNCDKNGRVAVTSVEQVVSDGPTIDPILFVVAASEPEDPWLGRIDEALAEVPAISLVADQDLAAVAAEADTEVVVLAERGVLPLPGCIESAAATVAGARDVGAAAVKLFAADGSLESAGSTVFADGSVAGIAAGLREVAAPWHEYVRPVCAARGLLAVRADAAREAAPKQAGSLLSLSAGLWQAGYQLRYQPDAWAVRALEPDSDATPVHDGTEVWPGVLANRPAPPPILDSSAWRAILAEDDMEGCWR